MDLRNLLILTSLFIFATLLSFQLDGLISINYIFIFFPLWLLWKMAIFASTIVGAIIICKNPTNQNNRHRVHVIMTLHNLILHVLLMTFECLLCAKFNGQIDMKWISIFSPALLASLVCSAFCYWCYKHDIPIYNLELFMALNCLIFLLIPLRLDQIIVMPWEIVFVPLLILLFVALIKILYELIFCGLEYATATDSNNQAEINGTAKIILFAMVFFPIFIFQALLVERLDGLNMLPFSIIALPLLVSLFAAIGLTILSNETDNFGVRNFRLLLNMMGIYGNILSINSCCLNQESDNEEAATEIPQVRNRPMKIPHYSFDTPD